eukprot:SM000055S18303  [mRNA]  locus=s55:705613:706002:- [translate_table: standard]
MVAGPGRSGRPRRACTRRTTATASNWWSPTAWPSRRSPSLASASAPSSSAPPAATCCGTAFHSWMRRPWRSLRHWVASAPLQSRTPTSLATV